MCTVGVSSTLPFRQGLLAVLALLAALLLLPPGSSSAALPVGCSQSAQTVTCTYTAGSNAFVVPLGVSSVHVTAVGGKGGDTGGAFGAVVTGDLPVASGATLYAVVGGNGGLNGSGANGGGLGGLPGFADLCGIRRILHRRFASARVGSVVEVAARRTCEPLRATSLAGCSSLPGAAAAPGAEAAAVATVKAPAPR